MLMNDRLSYSQDVGSSPTTEKKLLAEAGVSSEDLHSYLENLSQTTKKDFTPNREMSEREAGVIKEQIYVIAKIVADVARAEETKLFPVLSQTESGEVITVFWLDDTASANNQELKSIKDIETVCEFSLGTSRAQTRHLQAKKIRQKVETFFSHKRSKIAIDSLLQSTESQLKKVLTTSN